MRREPGADVRVHNDPRFVLDAVVLASFLGEFLVARLHLSIAWCCEHLGHPATTHAATPLPYLVQPICRRFHLSKLAGWLPRKRWG